MDRRSTLAFVIAAISLLAAVLWLDRAGIVPQMLLGGCVWLLLAAVFVRHRHLAPETLIAVAIATTGECILSLGLNIYGYRSGGVPLYVPPGHGVVYLLALQSSEHIRRYERLIVATTFVVGSIAAVGMAVMVRDTFGLACWIVTLMIASTSDRRLLMATCVAFTSVLEIAGTLAGNWRWHFDQGLLSSGNPPVGVVLLYCCLDLLTLMALNAILSRPQNASCSTISSGVDFDSTSRRAA